MRYVGQTLILGTFPVLTNKMLIDVKQKQRAVFTISKLNWESQIHSDYIR